MAVWNPTRRQLFLINLLFQSRSLPVLFPLADSAMDSHLNYYRSVLQDFSCSRLLDDSLFCVGLFCWISELWYLPFKLNHFSHKNLLYPN